MGDPAAKVDFLILGDGYTAAERTKFEKDARRLTELLFAVSPFRERRSDFNVWGLCPPAEESGISRPSSGIHRRSRIGSTYDAFGVERYVLTFENKAFRDERVLVRPQFHQAQHGVGIALHGQHNGAHQGQSRRHHRPARTRRRSMRPAAAARSLHWCRA